MLAPKRQELSPEEFDELPNGGSGSVEDGASEPSSPATKTMFPSSFGMTFCVGLDVKALQVTARWGHYHRDRSQTLTLASGDKKFSPQGSALLCAVQKVSILSGCNSHPPSGSLQPTAIEATLTRKRNRRTLRDRPVAWRLGEPTGRNASEH
jgi:hypothetical protein